MDPLDCAPPPQGYLSNKPGYLGDASHSLRARELYRYYQPPDPATTPRPSSDPPPSDRNASAPPRKLISSSDPVLTCFTILTAKLLNCRRCMITLVERDHSHVIAESTRSLSILTPHTSAPGEQLWLGSPCLASAPGGLCEHTVSLQPENEADELILEIEDLSKDPRYSQTPFVVSSPHERFYAGVALRTKNGISLGTFCVMDPVPKKLTPEQRMTLTKMGETCMRYLETLKEAGDAKRVRKMEDGLGRFIEEGYLEGIGELASEMQRRKGRLESTDEVKERALEEQGRRERVERKREQLQEMIEVEQAREYARRGENQQSTMAKSCGHDSIYGVQALSLETAVQNLVVKEPSPTATAFMEAVVESPVSFLDVRRASKESLTERPILHAESRSTSPFAATNPDYEMAANIAPAMRKTYSRAASALRESLGAEVLFVEGEQEGYYGADSCDGPVQVSTEREGQESNKDAKWGFRNGILGFATAAGCSNSKERASIDSGKENLGFNVRKLDPAFVKRLTQENPNGKIFSYNLSDEEMSAASVSQQDRDIAMKFRAFMPGSRSVMFLPIYGSRHKVVSVCFVWTTVGPRVFSSEVEGSYLTAFGNSIRAEINRLNIIGADKAKGDFISSISHELRSPLHGILASADFLAETTLDSFQKSFVETIISCGRTLLDTINHVLDFQKLNSLSSEAKKSGYGSRIRDSPCEDSIQETCAGILSASTIGNAISATNLSQLAEEVTEGVYLGYKFKGLSTPGITESNSSLENGGGAAEATYTASAKSNITVIVDIEPRDDGWAFMGQPGALKRILLNLGGNAMKYTDSGWVRIRLKAKNLPEEEVDGEKRSLVTLSISDSGKGIGREFLKTRLFTPFSQENSLNPGTGLGMSIVRQIVSLMPGGQIYVKSRVGFGTKVKVRFILKHRPSLGLLLPTIEEDVVSAVRKRVKGKKVALRGFEITSTFETYESSRKDHAVRLLRESLELYSTRWFGMTIVADTEEPDLVISREDGVVTLNSVPTVAVVSGALTDELLRLSRGSPGAVAFIATPVGPRKLAQALSECLDKQVKLQTNATLAEAPSKTATGKVSPVVGAAAASLNITTTEVLVYPQSSELQAPNLAPVPQKKRSLSNIGRISTVVEAGTDRPVLAKTRSISTTIPATPQARKKARVLCVEDNAINLMLLTTYLKRAGYTYEKATNGLEAVKAVERAEKGFDVIFMDLQMPVMGGIESSLEIRKLERSRNKADGNYKKSLIVALTGLATPSDQQQAYEAGINSFMVKPVRFNELDKWLEQVV